MFLNTAVHMRCRYGCRLRMRWSYRVQGPEERNTCIVDTYSVQCHAVMCNHWITEHRWKYLYLSRKVIFYSVLRFFCGSCRRRMSASPVALLHTSLSCATWLQLSIPICLMSFSTSYFHLASGLPVCRCWFKLGWYIFLVFLPHSTVVDVPSI